MKAVLITIAVSLAVGADLPALLKQKNKKDIIVYSVLVLFGYSVAMLTVMGITIPSPAKLIQTIVSHFVKIKFSY